MNERLRKRLKTSVCVCVILLVVFVVLSPLTLVKQGYRDNPYSPGKELKAEIMEETAGMTAEEIRGYSVKKTAKMLSFTMKNDLSKGEANCIGYAQMCASISNYAFKMNGIKATAKPVVGVVMFYGINLCNVLQSFMPTGRWKRFVQDHDFVEYHIDGETIYCDACAYDLIWKDCETVE